MTKNEQTFGVAAIILGAITCTFAYYVTSQPSTANSATEPAINASSLYSVRPTHTVRGVTKLVVIPEEFCDYILETVRHLAAQEPAESNISSGTQVHVAETTSVHCSSPNATWSLSRVIVPSTEQSGFIETNALQKI